MRVETAAPRIRLADYRPPAYLVDAVELRFRLDPDATAVSARIGFRPNPARGGEEPLDLRLDGRALRLVDAAIDGAAIPGGALAADAEGLTVAAGHVPQRAFTWTCETLVAPAANTALEGLYMSKDMYCTQCEAQGFRKITFYPDRPDVMAPFRVRIEGDAPVLLSNGNPVAAGPGWAEWHDPFPKPCYLFALVAGDLACVEDGFTTMSGRDVTLRIYVRPRDEARSAYAMDALKRAMAGDERAYGREYDLDLFMIVAVDDFNMGAMENKGLNIFNSKYVLASPETATDADYKAIEAIVAHEYFHNWTGNRITCRDWFQLSLKEGLTVFRDQQFSADARSAAVKRIEDVDRLRGQQFREDAGPLAHPVRPEDYIEINNFYTATVYEKGAELIRMLALLVGPETYRAALDLYFERHDGQACTIEDWLAVFEDASGRSLARFKRWYEQAGTPRVTASGSWADGSYTLTLAQRTPPTPGRAEKQPLTIPVAYGLLAPDGRALAEGLLELTEAEQSFAVPCPEPPVPSLLRGFSAPVILERAEAGRERAFLLAHDTDPFNRWEAGHMLALDLLARRAGGDGAGADDFARALQAVAADDGLEPAFKALMLALPSDEAVIAHIADRGGIPDPSAVHRARRGLERDVADALAPMLEALYAAHGVPGPYSPDAAAAGHRALRGRALALLTRRDPACALARRQIEAADNMTEVMAALAVLVRHGEAGEALDAFYRRWRGERNVIDKWFAVQAAHAEPGTAVAVVERLAAHADFDWRNPNRLRALLGTFAASNPAGFHARGGAGYRLFVDWLIRVDAVNPQTAARLAAALGTWRRYDPERQSAMRVELDRLAAHPGLSRDTGEILGRLLEPAQGGR
ncbi:aminopeptidase N [soil metagenome]